jgi:hypothetical protein
MHSTLSREYNHFGTCRNGVVTTFTDHDKLAHLQLMGQVEQFELDLRLNFHRDKGLGKALGGDLCASPHKRARVERIVASVLKGIVLTCARLLSKRHRIYMRVVAIDLRHMRGCPKSEGLC